MDQLISFIFETFEQNTSHLLSTVETENLPDTNEFSVSELVQEHEQLVLYSMLIFGHLMNHYVVVCRV